MSSRKTVHAHEKDENGGEKQSKCTDQRDEDHQKVAILIPCTCFVVAFIEQTMPLNFASSAVFIHRP